MNTPEHDLEATLRRAPRPEPPAGLKQTLIAQTRLPNASAAEGPITTGFSLSRWLRRWWPALVPGAVSVACAVAVTVQQHEIKQLKTNVQTLSEKAAAVQTSSEPVKVQSSSDGATASVAADYQQEIDRLRKLVSQLKGNVQHLEQVKAENVQLRSQLAAASGFSAEDLAELEKAKERAMRIACVNNLKQLGLAVRIWENDNGDVSPPDILSMTNEMGSPKILVCPADTSREAAPNWASYTAANCSYKYLAPSSPFTDPQRVLFWCPIHNNVGLCDGSVQQLAPDQKLVQRDGKYYLGPPSQ